MFLIVIMALCLSGACCRYITFQFLRSVCVVVEVVVVGRRKGNQGEAFLTHTSATLGMYTHSGSPSVPCVLPSNFVNTATSIVHFAVSPKD